MKNPPFEVDAPEESLGFLLWQVTMSWQRMIKKTLEEQEISHAQFVILAIVLWWEKQKKTLTQNEIIQMSKMDKMTVSKSLKILSEKGLVFRRESSTDTRVKVVSLTSKGTTLACKLVPLVETTDSSFFETLTKKQESDLLKLLNKLCR